MIINQPFNSSLGEHLIEQLQSKRNNIFRFIVAYAKTSGVNRLLPYMQQFRARGGKIFGVVGIDQFNTSYEALTSLCNVCDELHIYHSSDAMKTFHVKAYSFESKDNAWIAIGSHNLTFGGLFNNYEAGLFVQTSERDTIDSYLSIYNKYSDVTSPCCKKASGAFVDSLLKQGYIKPEKLLAIERIDEEINHKKRSGKECIFGRDSRTSFSKYTAVDLSKEATSDVLSGKQTESEEDQPYLVRFVPKAGDRSKQVHFTLDILQHYFMMKPGDELELQEISDIFTSKPIEHRSIVYSSSNKNVKIEVAAASILDFSYPTDLSQRPILLFRKRSSTFFEYMLIMSGNDGYDALSKHLLAMKWSAKSLQHETMDVKTLLSLWDVCPLV